MPSLNILHKHELIHEPPKMQQLPPQYPPQVNLHPSVVHG